MIINPKYYTQYPTCVVCGLVYTAPSSIEGGICVPCRSNRTITVINLASVVFCVAAIFIISLLVACAPAAAEESLSWHRCYRHGDWLETPYCDAAARDMENV